MKRLLLLISLLTFSVSVIAQETTAPTISFEKKLFTGGETVTLSYVGAPQPLTIKLQDSVGHVVGYKAIVSTISGDNLGKKALKILPYSPWQSGTYTIDVILGATQLLHDSFIIDSPSPSVVRSSSKIIEPNKNTTVTIHIPNDSIKEATSSYSLVESAPLDAVINDPKIQQVKKPELLNLRFPFNEAQELTLNFGRVDPAEHLGMPNHDGVDFAAASGTQIVAVDEGEVVPYREENNYGTTVAIQHLWGQSFYGHLSTSSAQLGDRVKKGQIIGFSGTTGRSTGPHLHFGVKLDDGQFIDPLPLLSSANNNKVAEKQLIFNVPATTTQVSYDMVMVRSEPVIQSVELSPAYILTSSAQPLFTEQEPHILLLNGEKDAGEKLIQDPHLTSGTLIKSQDGVIIWKNVDQSVLKVFDTVTNSFFEQALLANASNLFMIDTKEYRVDMSGGELRLSPVQQ